MLQVKEEFGQDACLLREQTPGVYSIDDGTTIVPFLGVPVAYDDTTGHKAIPVAPGVVLLTKSTAGTDYTLGTPVAGTDDGKTVKIITTTAAAHVVTAGAGLINAAASGVATFGAAIGNSIELVAYQGVWYTVGTPKGVTIT